MPIAEVEVGIRSGLERLRLVEAEVVVGMSVKLTDWPRDRDAFPEPLLLERVNFKDPRLTGANSGPSSVTE